MRFLMSVKQILPGETNTVYLRPLARFDHAEEPLSTGKFTGVF